MRRRNFMTLTGRTAAALAATRFWIGTPAARAAKPGRRIRIGQIGTGHAHARGKMQALRKLSDDFEVVGIAKPNAGLRADAEKDGAYKDLKWMTEEELLHVKGLEAVAVETDVPDLVPAAKRCVAAGMHVHLDKPAGTSLSAFKEVLDEAARQKRTVQMGYMLRYNPAFQLCFKAAQEGWLGEVFEVHAVMSKMNSASARKPLARFPGGAMFELGCHLIDAIVIILGKPNKVTPYPCQTRPEQDRLADNCLAVLEYPKATATVRSALIEVEGQNRRQFVVCGDKGTADVRPLEPPRMLLTLSEDRAGFQKGCREVELPEMPGRYDDQLLDFARVIRGEAESEYPPSHDLAVHETVLRAGGMPLG